jgi:hypothetical protein
MCAEIFLQSTVFETFLLLSSRKIAYCFLVAPETGRAEVPSIGGSDNAIGGHSPSIGRRHFAGAISIQ